MTNSDDALVIGGGAIGVSCAYYLAKAGRQVRLVERGQLSAGSSFGNAGLVPLSVSSPLAGPGVVGRSIRWLFDPDGAFRLRPRLDPSFAAWLWRFRRHCNVTDLRRSTAVIRDLLRQSQRLYEDLSGENLDFGYRRNGLLAVYRTDAYAETVASNAQLLKDFGIRVDVMDRRQVASLEPRISDTVLGGAYFPEDAHLDPAAFVSQLASVFTALGGSILTGVRVLKIRAGDRGSVAVETSSGVFNAQLVVLAAGVWSAAIAKGLAPRIPVEPGKGYSLTLPVKGTGFGIPIRMLEANTTYSPMPSSLRLTSKLDLVGFDTSIDINRVKGMAPAARRYLALDQDFESANAWAGLRPLTPDGLPIIDRHPSLSGLVIATGHGQLGVALAPVTGWLVAQLATNRVPPANLEPLGIERFGSVRAINSR